MSDNSECCKNYNNVGEGTRSEVRGEEPENDDEAGEFGRNE